MKISIKKNEDRRGYVAKLLCLSLAVLMLLTSCGKGRETSKDDKTSSEGAGNTSVVDNSNRKPSVPEQYSKLVWNDEFDGDKLKMNNWSYESTNGAQADKITLTDREHLYVKDGELVFKADHYSNPNNPNIKYADAPTIQTKYSMNFRYGYVEMCAKLPFCSTAWPALWTRTMINCISYTETDPTFMAEVDVFECFASEDTIVPSIHKWFTRVAWADGMPTHTEIDGKYKNKYKFKESENLKNEYHVYGWEWTPEYMAMFVDGVEYNSFLIADEYDFDGYGNMSGFRDPKHLLIGAGAVTSETAPDFILQSVGEPKDEDFPYEMKVDYIRVYQNPDEAESQLLLNE